MTHDPTAVTRFVERVHAAATTADAEADLPGSYAEQGFYSSVIDALNDLNAVAAPTFVPTAEQVQAALAAGPVRDELDERSTLDLSELDAGGGPHVTSRKPDGTGRVVYVCDGLTLVLTTGGRVILRAPNHEFHVDHLSNTVHGASQVSLRLKRTDD